MKKEITIIIPVFNKIEYTKSCIESIYINTDINLFNIIIVDNGSTDKTQIYLKEISSKYSNIKFITNVTNLGFSKANNQAAKICKTEKIIFLNNDTEVTENWLTELDKCLNKEIKIVGAKLLYQDNTIQHAGIVISESKFENNKIIYHIYRNFPENHFSVNKTRFFQAVTGACMLTYTDFFNSLGGFSEDYINGFEDIELCLKAGFIGAKILYCHKSKVYHHESKSTGRHHYTLKNTEIFYKKWNNKLIADDYKYYAEDGFKLISVNKKWNILHKNINESETIELKQESLDIILEQKATDPEILIFFKTEGNLNQTLSKLQTNTSSKFFAFVITDEKNFESKFNNIRLIEKKGFKLTDLSNIIESKNITKVVFSSPNNEISYLWDSKIIKYDKTYLLDIIKKIISKVKIKNISESLIHNLEYFIDDIYFYYFLSDYYLEKNNTKKELETLERALKTSPFNKDILKKLSQCLLKIGDLETAKKINEFL